MTASFEGHVDVARILIEAKAQVDTQEKVHYIFHPFRSNINVYIQCSYNITSK